MPFRDRRRPVLVEDGAAVKVPVLFDVIMDRGMNRGKILERLYCPWWIAVVVGALL